jgi:hypothetical protein
MPFGKFCSMKNGRLQFVMITSHLDSIDKCQNYNHAKGNMNGYLLRLYCASHFFFFIIIAETVVQTSPIKASFALSLENVVNQDFFLFQSGSS